MFFIYQFLLSIIIIISPLIVIIRIFKNKEDKIRFKEKFCFFSKKRGHGKLVWFHGASVGEIMSVLPIINEFEKNRSVDKILITKSVAIKLNINDELPLIEVLEIKKNKSFIAEKAKIFKEEKNISSKAPVTSVKIANISKKKINIKKINSSNIYIFVASFYTNEAATILKKRIIKETPNYDIKKLKIRKKTNKQYEVLSGPYKSINLLKNDYINLKIFGFEELDIFINE